jgi:hypothetical protein
MGEHRPDTSFARHEFAALPRIPQQGATEAATARTEIDRKTREHHHRHGIRHVAAHGRGRIAAGHRTRREGCSRARQFRDVRQKWALPVSWRVSPNGRRGWVYHYGTAGGTIWLQDAVGWGDATSC